LKSTRPGECTRHWAICPPPSSRRLTQPNNSLDLSSQLDRSLSLVYNGVRPQMLLNKSQKVFNQRGALRIFMGVLVKWWAIPIRCT
jgi:hypothetical protein